MYELHIRPVLHKNLAAGTKTFDENLDTKQSILSSANQSTIVTSLASSAISILPKYTARRFYFQKSKPTIANHK